LPTRATLPSALCGDADARARLVRAAVVDLAWATEVFGACRELLEDGAPRGVAVALVVGSALNARSLVGPVTVALTHQRETWRVRADPLTPTQSLAASALHFLSKAALPRDDSVTEVFAWGLEVDDLCRLAWRRLGQRAPAAVLERLPTLLRLAPDLADEVGTVFALVHGELVVDAARAVAGVEEPARSTVAAAMEKHLYRIKAIKRWVACRRALAGKA